MINYSCNRVESLVQSSGTSHNTHLKVYFFEKIIIGVQALLLRINNSLAIFLYIE